MRIKLDNLKKTYTSVSDGEKRKICAVDSVSLDIPENTIFGIIGKSGAGKSSLIRLVSLLETPDSGAVYYDDKRVDNLSKKELIQQRRTTGMIFQNFNLFSSRTAGKNVAYPLEISGYPRAKIWPRVREMLSLVGLEDRIDAPISTLSGGQKQRVAIARALATEPGILFCDEAERSTGTLYFSAADISSPYGIIFLVTMIAGGCKAKSLSITWNLCSELNLLR